MKTGAALHFASRYVLRHLVQSALLALALGVVVALPAAVRIFARTVEREMHARAAATPQIVGSKGSSLDLMLAALYFRREPIGPITLRQLQSIDDSGLGRTLPLLVRYASQGSPIVGVSLDYFSFRNLPVREGRMMTRLGDCVIGSAVAAARGIKPGDFVFSSPEQVFDIAGVYPLKMRVTGVLAPAYSPDDQAVFVDLKTAWLIEGRAHGHEDLAKPEASADVLKREEGNVVGNAAVRMFNEVTDANIGSFHFHGETQDYPVTAAIVLPSDVKSEAILAGRYQEGKNGLQLIRPLDELEQLLSTLFRLEGAALAGLALVGGAALAVAVIVFVLSFKMRRREFLTLENIGVSHQTLRLAKLFEIALVSLAGIMLAVLMAGAVALLSPSLLTWGMR